MKYIECPDEFNGVGKSIFLGGGISNCFDWQQNMTNMLSDTDLSVINPRRASFDVNDDSCSIFQIEWEYEHLNKVDAVLFWFTPETLCPITLYELGARCMTNVKIFIGIDPSYKRKLDVEVQTELVRPDIEIVYSLEVLAETVKNWSNHETI